MALTFDEETMLNGNIFKYEERLKSNASKYVENGTTLVTYFAQKENAVTVDRGTRDIDQIFGKKSPLRFIKIINFPVRGLQPLKPDNIEENNIEDFNVEGDLVIIPRTMVPKQYDFFIINHVKMKAIFMVTDVKYDNMRVDGYYSIHYRLFSTSDETIQNLERQTDDICYTDLNAVGSDVNPIITEDNFILRGKISQMISYLITTYRALFYNDRHNCFLYEDPDTGMRYFDMCGNEFMAKHSIMNEENSSNVILLHDKLYEEKMLLHYNNSVYNWIELGASERLLQRFRYMLRTISSYPTSTFYAWAEDDIHIMLPIGINQKTPSEEYSFFDNNQLNAFLDPNKEPVGSEYDKLIWKYIYKRDSLSVNDVSLDLAGMLINSVNHIDVFLYTPIVIYIIREILRMN